MPEKGSSSAAAIGPKRRGRPPKTSMPQESTEFVQPPVVLPDAAPRCQSTVTEKRKRGRPPKASIPVLEKAEPPAKKACYTMSGKNNLHCREVYNVLLYSH